jgi:hypothetical protein
MYARLLSSLALLGLLPATAGCEFHFEKRSNPVAPAEAEGPAPAASTTGTDCTAEDPASILGCERGKYGHMNDEEVAEFLKHAAESLNRNNIAGGPYGVLRKETGSNCAGYSCDIICAGDGTDQRQYDVLLDSDGSQQVTWGDAQTHPHIRVDQCEIH